MLLNKQEFKVLVMLYAANIDGNIQSEEVKVMLKKTDFDTVEKVEKLFAKMSDMEVLECIRENKALYAATEADRFELIHDLCAIIEADEKVSVMEGQIVRAIMRTIENANQMNQEKEDKNKQDSCKNTAPHDKEESQKDENGDEIEKLRKEIIKIAEKFNVLKQCEDNLTALSKQIESKEEDNKAAELMQEKELLIATWKKGRTICLIFAIFAFLFFVMAAVRSCDPHISLPFIIGSVSSLVIMAIVVVVFVRQTRAVHKSKNNS